MNKNKKSNKQRIDQKMILDLIIAYKKKNFSNFVVNTDNNAERVFYNGVLDKLMLYLKEETVDSINSNLNN